jgi:predicted transposase/invertase (TIGR01784 family)
MKLSPRVDFAFKLIFEQHKDMLMSLINAVVSEKDQVQDIEIRNPYTAKMKADGKFSVLDIKAQATNGTYYNIEVQVTDDLNYDKRTLYYWAKLYSEQLISGDNYAVLQKTIGIHILNFDFLDETDYHNMFQVRNTKSGKKLSDMLELHYIELPKVPTDFRYIQNTLDRWCAFLARAERYTESTLPESLSCDPMIRKAMHVFETTRLQDEELETYEARLKWLRDETSALETKYLRGKAEGLAEGLAEGEAKLEAERQRSDGEKRDMAQKMEAMGIDKKTIQQLTGLASW